MNEQITLLYVHSRSMGYGRAGCDLASGLSAQGVDVYDDQGPSPVKITAQDAKVIREGRRQPPAPTNAICWVSVPTHARWWYRDQHASILTMWEAGTLPPAFRDTLHEFDRVLVPSWHNVELFSKYHDNVEFLPLGVSDQWRYAPRPEVGADFRFLIGGSGPRKGTDVAYDAFRKVFGHWFSDGNYTGPEPRPWLVMKNPRGEDFYGPFVEMVTGKLTDAEEVALYESCHAYLQPSRGEGFGLQPLQAIAQGLPTILTNAHGHESFAHLGIPVGWQWADADYFIYGDAGLWWEPDLDEVCEAMWDVYTNYAHHVDKAKMASRIACRDWTTGATAAKFRDLTPEMREGPISSRDVRIPEQKLYLVRVTERRRADIGGLVYIFEPGRDYHEPADVKRILFESGHLDPSCLVDTRIGVDSGTIDVGLSPRQLGALEDYSAAHGYCPTCSQRLNTVPTRADDLYDEATADALVAQAGA